MNFLDKYGIIYVGGGNSNSDSKVLDCIMALSSSKNYNTLISPPVIRNRGEPSDNIFTSDKNLSYLLIVTRENLGITSGSRDDKLVVRCVRRGMSTKNKISE